MKTIPPKKDQINNKLVQRNRAFKKNEKKIFRLPDLITLHVGTNDAINSARQKMNY